VVDEEMGQNLLTEATQRLNESNSPNDMTCECRMQRMGDTMSRGWEGIWGESRCG
jgi:hypothetical protein